MKMHTFQVSFFFFFFFFAAIVFFLGRAIVIRQAFLKVYPRHSVLAEKYNSGPKTLLHKGISELEFYGDLVYRFRKIVGQSNFSEQFRKLINHYKKWLYPVYYAADCMPSYQPSHC